MMHASHRSMQPGFYIAYSCCATTATRQTKCLKILLYFQLPWHCCVIKQRNERSRFNKEERIGIRGGEKSSITNHFLAYRDHHLTCTWITVRSELSKLAASRLLTRLWGLRDCIWLWYSIVFTNHQCSPFHEHRFQILARLGCQCVTCNPAVGVTAEQWSRCFAALTHLTSTYIDVDKGR